MSQYEFDLICWGVIWAETIFIVLLILAAGEPKASKSVEVDDEDHSGFGI
jgi:hypothetical protein